MQGLGVFIFVVGYALVYTSYEQGFGSGGSFLYWLTGNPGLGSPTPSSSSHSQGGGGSRTPAGIQGSTDVGPSKGSHGVLLTK